MHAGSHLAAGFDERSLRKGVVGNAVWGLPFRQGQKQIPFENDRKKGKDKGNHNAGISPLRPSASGRDDGVWTGR
jgi:hypothetical protein